MDAFRIGLVSIHPQRLSGQIDSLVGLAGALRDRSHQVEILTPCSPDQQDERRTNNHTRLPLPLRAFGMIDTLRQAAAAATRFDLIHLNLPTPAFSFAADWLQQHVRVPVVVGYEAHLMDVKETFRSRHLQASPRFYLPYLMINNRWLAGRAQHNCAKYIVSSQYQKKELLQLRIPEQKINVIANIIDTAKLKRWPRAVARTILGLPEGRMIAYYGHFHHVKGLDRLIRAFPQIAATLPDAYLAIAWSGLGPGRELQRLIDHTGVGNRIIMLDRIDVGQFLSAADVAVFPYRLSLGQQAYPNCVLESLTLGVPLITGDLPLFREICRHEINALLVPPDNNAALSQAITRVLVEPGLRERLQHGAQHLVKTDLDKQTLAKEYERIYEQTLRRQTYILQAA